MNDGEYIRNDDKRQRLLQANLLLPIAEMAVPGVLEPVGSAKTMIQALGRAAARDPNLQTCEDELGVPYYAARLEHRNPFDKRGGAIALDVPSRASSVYGHWRRLNRIWRKLLSPAPRR